MLIFIFNSSELYLTIPHCQQRELSTVRPLSYRFVHLETKILPTNSNSLLESDAICEKSLCTPTLPNIWRLSDFLPMKYGYFKSVGCYDSQTLSVGCYKNQLI